MELGTDKQRLVQQYMMIAGQLDRVRYEAPADVNPNLISAMHNAAMNARRLDFDVSDLRIERYHYKMMMYAEEIQYHVQNELGDSLLTRFGQDKMSEVEERINTRDEMSRDEWKDEEFERISEGVSEQHKRLREIRDQSPDELLDEFEEADG
jgi:hypothetical protein